MPNSPFPPSSKAINSAVLGLLLLAGSEGMAGAQSAEDLHIARRSSFEMPAATRDPFVPIGWKQPGAAVLVANGNPVVRTVESYILPTLFVVSSISLDRIPLAVINGKTYGEGDLMAFNAGGEKIQLQVHSIRDGAVTLRYKAYQVVCPIRAAQLPKPAFLDR